jgi:lysophospholipase L1-like esterase
MNKSTRYLLAAAALGGWAVVLQAQNATAPVSQAIGGIQAVSTTSSYKFFFGTGDAPAGYTKITGDMAYNDTRGYGFDAGTKAAIVSKNNVNLATADKQFYFSTALPEGNYKVTVTMGNPDVATDVSVKAESRRLMLQNVQTKAGEYVTKTFIVNIRTPKYGDGQLVNLKAPRESQKEAWDWDNGLTLEFNGDHPSISDLRIEKVDVPTIYLVGDSTSCDQVTEPFNSWGQTITVFFKPTVAFANHGESGEDAASCLGRHRFDKIWSEMKPGDYLLIQFGHNDMKAPRTLAQYTDALQRIADGTKKAGGTLIIVTPMNRHTFSGNTVTNSLQGYPYAAWQVAKDNQLGCVELNGLSKVLYESFGPDKSEDLFAETSPGKHDGTHHSDFGSYELAKCVILGLQQTKLGINQYIVDDFHFDPAHPDQPSDFKVTPTPRQGTGVDKPPGN